MVRNDVRGRLQTAALAQFREHGFEQTTAAQIAALAGVTERTFFRHFRDKREVLFAAEEVVRTSILAGIASAPAGLGPLDTIFRAYDGVRSMIEERRSYAKSRQDLIGSTPALQERELAKIAVLADAIAGALEDRGIPGPHAKLAASIGMATIAQVQIEWLDDESVGLADRLEQARSVIRQLV